MGQYLEKLNYNNVLFNYDHDRDCDRDLYDRMGCLYGLRFK